MRYQSFLIRNFRGIRHLELHLGDYPKVPIVTLVGLNESGKTTILEALSFFYDNIGAQDEIRLVEGIISDVHTLIPKRLRANFNDRITLESTLSLENQDKDAIVAAAARAGFRVSGVGEQLRLTHHYEFKNSRYTRKQHEWNIRVSGTPRRGRQARELISSDLAYSGVIQELKRHVPAIIYYPNFLFDFPDRIYLSANPGEGHEQPFYRQLIQDVLDSLAEDLSIQTHLIARATSPETADHEALESVTNKLGLRITSLVLDKELSVFQDRSPTKTISITRPQADATSGTYYIEFKLRDGEDSFYIRERSLGFRWFFTFLLFTQFRLQREASAPPLFLFDEPASNLHQTAQRKLLSGFERLATGDKSDPASIIYATHSHHMINPQWLEGAFIVQNRALTYEDEDVTRYTAAQTDIAVTRYREFAAAHPDQRTYFQPILDVLEYRPGQLEDVPSAVMVEGKNDFYTIAYISSVVLTESIKAPLMPGNGAGSLDVPIQLYTAWGRDFIVLLDSDAEGARQKERYQQKFGALVAGRVFLLSDVDHRWAGKRMEELIDDPDRLRIQRVLDPEARQFRKKVFFLALQQCLARREHIRIGKRTTQRFHKLLARLSERLRGAGEVKTSTTSRLELQPRKEP